MLALEVPVFGRQFQTIATVNTLRAGLSVGVDLGVTGEPWLDLTRRGTTVAIDLVAVVALLSSLEIAVSARSRAGVCRTCPVGSPADRLLRTGV